MAPKPGAMEGCERIREQLDRILRSPELQLPDRGHRFLRHVVDEALQGRSEQLDADAIAKAIFGRGPGFDARSDPIVLIEAGRVRRALERYYLICGSKDPVTITIPKGQYAPSFEETNTVAGAPGSCDDAKRTPARQETGTFSYKDLLVPLGVPAVLAALTMLALIRPLENYLLPSPVQPAIRQTRLAGIAVAPFAVLGRMPDGADIARGLRDQLISQLRKVDDVVVLDPRRSAAVPAAVSKFALQGSISRERDIMHVQARLIAGADGRVIWAKRFDGGTGGRSILELQALICAQIVQEISVVQTIRNSALPH